MYIYLITVIQKYIDRTKKLLNFTKKKKKLNFDKGKTICI